MSHHDVVVGVILNKWDRVLVQCRSLEAKRWPGSWEFPGGKREVCWRERRPGGRVVYEEYEDALRREVKEETGLVEFDIMCKLLTMEQIPDDSGQVDRWTLHVYLCQLVGAEEPRPVEGQRHIKWMDRGELDMIRQRGYTRPAFGVIVSALGCHKLPAVRVWPGGGEISIDPK